MGMWLKQSTASQEVLLGPFVDSTDGNTAETGLTIANTDIKIWKDGTTTLANKNSGGATHISDGYYYAVLDATDTDTLGKLEVNVKVSGALAVRREFMVLPANVYDSLVSGTDVLNADVTQFGGTNGTFSVGRPEVNTTHWGGTAIASATVRSDLINIAGVAVSTTTAQLGVNVVQVSGDSAAADNLEAATDGTGYNIGGGQVVAASVTGAVGSVAGNVGGNVTGSVGSVTGSVGSVTGSVGSIATNGISNSSFQNSAITGSKIASNAIVATTLANDTGLAPVTYGTAQAGSSSSVTLAASGPSSTTDFYKGMLVGLRDGTGGGQWRYITAYNGSTKVATISPDWATAPDGTTTYVVTRGSYVPWNSLWDAEVQSEVQDAIEVNHLDHLLAADYDPASKPGVSTALLNELVEDDGGVSRFTTNALEQNVNINAGHERAVRTMGWGTVTTGATTTSIPTSAMTPSGAAADQFKGRVIIFDKDTTTTALRGQATDITASSNAATPTFTVTALTTAPASGDTFVIV